MKGQLDKLKKKMRHGPWLMNGFSLGAFAVYKGRLPAMISIANWFVPSPQTVNKGHKFS